MEQLPDLRSDADVDALMARLRAKLSAAASAVEAPARPAEPSGNALRDFLAVHEEHVSATVRAMQVIAETMEEMQTLAAPTQHGRARSSHRPDRRRRISR